MAETHRVQAASVVTPFFRQDEKLIPLRFNQPARTGSATECSNPTDQEMQRIADIGLRAGILDKRRRHAGTSSTARYS